MTEIFRTNYEPREQPEAVVIQCSDPRYQQPCQEFLRSHLNGAGYALVAVPGGPQFLTLIDHLPKFSWAGWRWMKFLVDVARPRRVILIAHEDCRWYQDNRFWGRTESVGERQRRDLETARAGIAERFPNLGVELIYARIDGAQVTFDRL